MRQFIQQYFLIFDSEKREPLMKAYARDTCLTMFNAHSPRNSSQLNGYLMDGRKNNTNEKNYRSRGVCQLLHISLKCHIQMLNSESQTTYEEIQMTDPDIQVEDQNSSVCITEPLPVQLPENVKQQMTMNLNQQTNMYLQ